METKVSTMIRRIGQMGLDEETRARVTAAIRGEERPTVRIPRDVTKRVSAAVQDAGSAVVVLGKSGKFKVYSVEGYMATSAAAKKHRPWIKGHAASAAKHAAKKKAAVVAK